MNTTEEKVKSANDYMAQKATGNAGGRFQQGSSATADAGRQDNRQASGVVAAVGEKAHDVAAAVSECVADTKKSVQQMAHSAADSVTHAKDSVVHWASDAAQHSGQYLSAGNDELTRVIRRNPVSTLLVAIG